MNTFEEWKMHFTYHFIKFLISIDTPEKHWFSTIQGEISPWEDEKDLENPILDWKTTSPQEAVREAFSYWEE
ncbi:hypothetical protein [Yersinia phage fHe-Yen9-03]|uniref:Uncharacterized protein n=1 Tax=Yersinia phage fHe-Yen9-03 TaxID=2052743 RepID=A0A2C9D043_9CAUD|nr:hypothetical protein [Yersinia phage fHe-Yen9-03]